MNKIILLILVSLNLLIAKEINEHKIDLFFGNGIATTFKEAVKTNLSLNEMFYNRTISLKDVYFNKTILNEYKYNEKIAYNNTYGVINDLIESINQKDIIFSCAIISTISTLTQAEDILIEKIKTSTMTEESKIDFENKLLKGESVCSIIKGLEEYDLSNQLLEYKKSINEGHRIMAVVHSQGNLFLNEIYKNLEDWEKEYIEAYGIATPANYTFKENNEESLNNYITLNEDPIRFLSDLKGNVNLSEEEKEKYNISFTSGTGHFISNYIKIPKVRELIAEGIENKTTKLLKVQSQYSIENQDDYCQKKELKNKFNNEIVEGFIFNENGKVNTFNSEVFMNSRFLKNAIELNNDINNCYTETELIDYIKRLDVATNGVNIELLDNNNSYKIIGNIDNYDSSKSYIGYLKDINSEKEIENILFEKKGNNLFESSFSLKTSGEFYFYIKENNTKSNEVFVKIDRLLFNDNLKMEENLNIIKASEFYDPIALNYNLQLLKLNEKTNEYEIIEEFNLDKNEVNNETIQEFKMQNNGSYIVILLKENKLGEKIKLSRNNIFELSNIEDIFVKDFLITYEMNDYYLNQYKAKLLINLKNMSSKYITYYEDLKTNQSFSINNSYTLKNFSYLKNGHVLRFKLTIKNKETNVIIFEKDIEKMIDEEIEYYKEPSLSIIENCNNINDSTIRVNNLKALNDNMIEFIINGVKIEEKSEEGVLSYNFNGLNFSENQNIEIKSKNTITNKFKNFNYNYIFDVSRTNCALNPANKFIYSTKKDSNGLIYMITYKTNYYISNDKHGKIEVYLNNELKKTYYNESNFIELMVKDGGGEFRVDPSENNQISIKIYDLYNINIKAEYIHNF